MAVFFFKKKSQLANLGPSVVGRDHGCFAGLCLELFGSLYRGHGCHGPMGLGSQKTKILPTRRCFGGMVWV